MNLENSLFKVVNSPLNKTICVPTSKSYSNRALILAALRGSGTNITNLSQSTDVQNLLKSLIKVGLKIEQNKDDVTIINSFPACEEETLGDSIDLETGDGGTTNRFLIALLSRGKKQYNLYPTEKLSERPIEDLLSPLKKLGVNISHSFIGPWLSIQGPAKTQVDLPIEINCEKSTQFASAMILSFSNTNIKFNFSNVYSSKKYLDLTQSMLLAKNFNIPIDFSSISYPVALALFQGKVLISNCHSLDSTQADSELFTILKNLGADINFTNGGLAVSNTKTLKPFVVDGVQFPDLVPTLAFIASKIEGVSRLENLSVLSYKESDRLAEIINLLKAFEVDFHFISESTTLVIKGSTKKVDFKSYTPSRDHRMVMTAYLFMRANSGGELDNIDCVDKSYPNFFSDLENHF
jgi:3-phosphoshikimate 1-carboxyvinyltransferase